MSIRPRNDNVLVRFDPDPERLGSVLVPAGAGGPRPIDGVWARVLAVGPGHHSDRCPRCLGELIPTQVRAGDHVIVDSKESGQPVWIDGVEHRLVRESELHLIAEA